MKRTEELTENETRIKGKYLNEFYFQCLSNNFALCHGLTMLAFLFLSGNCSYPKGVSLNREQIRGAQQNVFRTETAAGKQHDLRFCNFAFCSW